MTAVPGTITQREFDEALNRLSELLDSITADDCIDGDECDEWRDQCPYHLAIDFLCSYGREWERP